MKYNNHKENEETTNTRSGDEEPMSGYDLLDTHCFPQCPGPYPYPTSF